jgi:hypothetical protein
MALIPRESKQLAEDFKKAGPHANKTIRFDKLPSETTQQHKIKFLLGN